MTAHLAVVVVIVCAASVVGCSTTNPNCWLAGIDWHPVAVADAAVLAGDAPLPCESLCDVTDAAVTCVRCSTRQDGGPWCVLPDAKEPTILCSPIGRLCAD